MTVLLHILLASTLAWADPPEPELPPDPPPSAPSEPSDDEPEDAVPAPIGPVEAVPTTGEPDLPDADSPPPRVGPGVATDGEPAALPQPKSTTQPTIWGARDSLVKLHDTRWTRARNSNFAFVPVGVAETGLGIAMMAVGKKGSIRSAGFVLGTAGALHATSGVMQLRWGQRRHAAFAARLAEIEGAPTDAWLALVEDGRLSLERQARANAFAAGIHAALAATGTALFVATVGREGTSDTGATMALAGGLGMLHFGFRWRAAVRLSNDMAVLDSNVPSLVPKRGNW